MRKKIVALMGLMVLAFGLSGCEYEEIQGVVTDKDTYRQTTYVKVGEVSVPTYTESERLTVKYQKENGETTTRQWSVRESVYDSCEVGNAIQRDSEGNIICSLR